LNQHELPHHAAIPLPLHRRHISKRYRMMNETPAEIAAHIESLLPNVKCGTLRFWGQWFGRPYDSCHTVVAAESAADTLIVRFDAEEKLTVVHPAGVSISSSQFRIQSASKVIWEWFYYGRPATPDHLYREEYARQGNEIVATSTVDWYTPDLRPSATCSAVEIV